LYNIPNVDAFINRKKANYVGKISRSDETTYPKKFLAAWINKRCKNGAPQLSCNNNFARVITQILPRNFPLSSNQAPLKDWIPLAKDPMNWQNCIDDNFEACHFIDPNNDQSDTLSISDNDNFSTA
jgi:hypothetical protein